MRRVSSTGFSLIELLVVLAIFSFVIAIAMPAFSEWIANARVKSAASALQIYLDSARVEAGRRGRVIEVILTNDSPTTLDPDPADDGRNIVVQLMTRADTSVAEEVLKGGSLYSDASSATLTGLTASTMAFSPFGRLIGGADVEFVFATDVATRAVKLTLSASGSTQQCVFSTSYLGEDGAISQGSGC